MPLPLIVVEVPAQDRGASETAALIEACTGGLGGGRCQLTQTRDPESVSAVAIVSWRDDQRLGALVEVSRVRQPSESWRSEELRFKPEDQRLERFRALGLAIATLFREAQPPNGASTPEPPDFPRKKPASAARRTAAPTRTKPSATPNEPINDEASGDTEASSNGAKRGSSWHPAAWISAGAFAAYDPELGAGRAGGQLQFAVGAVRSPGFLSALGSYALGPSLAGVSLSWATLGFGPGIRLPLAPSVELRGVARGLMVDVAGRVSEASGTSQQNVWVPGAGFELELAVRTGDRVSASLAADLQQLAGNVPIREHNQLAGTAGRTAFGVTLSLQWWLSGSGRVGR